MDGEDEVRNVRSKVPVVGHSTSMIVHARSSRSVKLPQSSAQTMGLSRETDIDDVFGGSLRDNVNTWRLWRRATVIPGHKGEEVK